MSQAEINISNLELSELVEAIYQAPFKKDWESVFNQIMDYTYSNKVFWYFFNVKKQETLVSEFSTKELVPAETINDFFSRPHEDPYYHVTKNMLEGETLYLNQHFNLEEYKGKEFYDNILVPMDSGQAICGVMNRDAEFEAIFAVNRGFNEPTYSQQDINLVSMLTPHLQTAIHLFRELELNKTHASVNKSIIDQSNKGILICDQQSNILLANSFAEQVFDQVPELIEKCGKLASSNEKTLSDLAELICDSAGFSVHGIKTKNTMFFSSQSENDVFIEISPLDVTSELNNFALPCCLISIKLATSMQWNAIQAEYNLTTREKDILQRVYRKQKLANIADEFNIAYQTVRNHMQNIYKKFAVNSQSELMVKLAGFQ